MTVPVHLIRGGDAVLMGEALTGLLDELIGDGDRALMLDEFDPDQTSGEAGLTDQERAQAGLGAAIDAAQTMPFLTERRVVVIRRLARFSKKDQIAELLNYLENPLDVTSLVLVWDPSQSHGVQNNAVPPTLTKAVKAAGGVVVDAAPTKGRGGDISGWVAEQMKAAGLDVEPRAQSRIAEVLGEDAGALVGIIERLKGAFAPGSRLGLSDIEPFVGPSGGVPPWDLTDAIDKGDISTAIDLVQRMMRGGDRHPLAIMASLQSHYLRMVRLDGAGARTDREAADILGMKGSTFPAKKAMNQARKLGSVGVRRAVDLVAGADRDLRGARSWDGELVMEVLVARLARLSR